MPQPVLNARALKCTIVLDPAEVAQIVAPTASRTPSSQFACPDRRVSADLNAKSVRVDWEPFDHKPIRDQAGLHGACCGEHPLQRHVASIASDSRH